MSTPHHSRVRHFKIDTLKRVVVQRERERERFFISQNSAQKSCFVWQKETNVFENFCRCFFRGADDWLFFSSGEISMQEKH